MQFSNKSKLESGQQITKIDLDYYVFNHQQFRMTNTVLHNLQNTNSMILPTEISPGNPITDYQQQQQQQQQKIQSIFASIYSRNFSWISLSCIIYRTSTDHALID